MPPDCEVCLVCDGRALVSSYDMGMKSFLHDPRMAVIRPCIGCGGVGYRLSSKAPNEGSQQ